MFSSGVSCRHAGWSRGLITWGDHVGRSRAVITHAWWSRVTEWGKSLVTSPVLELLGAPLPDLTPQSPLLHKTSSDPPLPSTLTCKFLGRQPTTLPADPLHVVNFEHFLPVCVCVSGGIMWQANSYILTTGRRRIGVMVQKSMWCDYLFDLFIYSMELTPEHIRWTKTKKYIQIW